MAFDLQLRSAAPPKAIPPGLTLPCPLMAEIAARVPLCVLCLTVLPSFLNPEELIWGYAKRTWNTRYPLRAGETLVERVDSQLSQIEASSKLVR